jgi:tetratricopeptide (TPR) repeat protein
MPDARTLYREGFQHYVKGDLDDAVARYRDALALDDSLALAWNGLSLALGRQGQLDEAIVAAHRLIELEPDDPLSHTNLSRLLQQQGLIPEAEEEKAIAMNLQMKQQD